MNRYPSLRVAAGAGMLFLSICCFPGSAAAQLNLSIAGINLSALEISGFGDVLFTGVEDEPVSAPFSVNQFELDIAASLHDHIEVSTAVAYDNAASTFGIGELFVDFHLFGSEGNHFRNVEGLDHSGLIVGQFDVPFGIDWRVYPSIDRKFVSGPLVVERTHEYWNDMGIQLYLDNAWGNVVAYTVNGFSYDGVAEIDQAVGGRFGLTPLNGVEIGGSIAAFYADGEPDMTLSGVDCVVEYSDLTLKGEYITRKSHIIAGDVVAAAEDTDSGFYGEAVYSFGAPFVMARYDSFSPSAGSRERRMSSGLGYVVAEGCEIRGEYQLCDDAADQFYLQLVFGF